MDGRIAHPIRLRRHGALPHIRLELHDAGSRQLPCRTRLRRFLSDPSREKINHAFGVLDFLWGPGFGTVLPENVQQVIDLSPLLNELISEIRKIDDKLFACEKLL